MDIQTSIRTCFQKYADFSGRAQRSEFWWFALFTFVTSLILQAIDVMIGLPILGSLFALAVLLPSIAVGVRRLHDRDMAGWWYLLIFVPLVGALILLVIFCLKGTDGPNRFGPDPLA